MEKGSSIETMGRGYCEKTGMRERVKEAKTKQKRQPWLEKDVL